MTEESWRINPILAHIIEDCITEGNNTDKAFDKATKIFDKMPKDQKHLDEKPFICPLCGETFETEKYG